MERDHAFVDPRIFEHPIRPTETVRVTVPKQYRDTFNGRRVDKSENPAGAEIGGVIEQPLIGGQNG